MKGRVLVISGEVGIRRNIASGLAREGYDVTACPDGVCAIYEFAGAREKKEPYTHLVTGIFLPDIDGMEILKAVRVQRPGLPVLVIAEFGNEALESAVLSERNTAYLDEPVEISGVVKALEELSPESDVGAGEVNTVPEMREPARACLAIRITEPARSEEIFRELRGMNGVERCDAVRGDFDMIVMAQGGSREETEKLNERIGSLRGVEVVFFSGVECPKFDQGMDEFIRVYSQAVKARGVEGLDQQAGRASYIFVDVDRNAVQRIFTTVFFASEVVFCGVVDGGARLIGMIAEQGTVGVTPRIIGKLGRMDGVLRVREAAVIRLAQATDPETIR